MSIEATMEKTYSSSDIQKIAKITKIQAIHWTQTEIITPLKNARGRGSRRLYSWGNIIEMMVCRELNKYNIERFLMKKVISIFNMPFRNSNCSSYWEYLKENPNTDILYLIFTIPVSKVLQGNAMGWAEDLFLNLSVRNILDEYRILAKELWEHIKKSEDSFIMITEKKPLDFLTQIHKSCVIVNIGALIEEAKQA